jgi:hypothetical protein
VDRSLAEQKLLAKLAGFFGILALLLASIGLYGVIAYSIARRAANRSCSSPWDWQSAFRPRSLALASFRASSMK